MTSDNSPVWFITGCSTGFGRELAKLVLDRGWCAVVTARDTSRVQDLLSGREDRALALALDVTDAGQVEDSVKAAEERFGVIDVLVNNADLVLGAFGVEAVRGKLAGVIEEIDAWKETSLGADFPQA